MDETTSPKNPRKPTIKQTAFVDGLTKGKSARQAALDAGYAESTAAHAGRDIIPATERNFQDLVRRHIPAELVIMRIAEGLSAMETKLATCEGKITDQRELIAWGERRMWAELASKLGGYYQPSERIDFVKKEDAEAQRAQMIARLLGTGPAGGRGR